MRQPHEPPYKFKQIALRNKPPLPGPGAYNVTATPKQRSSPILNTESYKKHSHSMDKKFFMNENKNDIVEDSTSDSEVTPGPGAY